MKIVHLITGLAQGGAETFLGQLIAAWDPQDQHTVVYFKDGPLKARFEQQGIMLRRLWPRFGYFDPRFFCQLVQLMKQERPDRLYCHLWMANWWGRLASKLLNLPCFEVLHATSEHQGPVRNLLDRLAPQATYSIAVAQGVAASFASSGKRLVVIPNGIALQAAPSEHGKESLPSSKLTTQCPQTKVLPHYTVGAVGRLIPAKGFDLLIVAFAQFVQQHPQAQLIIVGEGPERHKLELLITKLHVTNNVHLVGLQPAADYYPFFDCFVQPSHTEGMSIALLEAMSYAKPVIVTGYKHEVVNDQVTGLLCKPHDPQALCIALNSYYHSKILAQQLGLAGQAHVRKHHNITVTAAAYRKLAIPL